MQICLTTRRFLCWTCPTLICSFWKRGQAMLLMGPMASAIRWPIHISLSVPYTMQSVCGLILRPLRTRFSRLWERYRRKERYTVYGVWCTEKPQAFNPTIRTYSLSKTIGSDFDSLTLLLYRKSSSGSAYTRLAFANPDSSE